MCVGVPMIVLSTEGLVARCRGAEGEVEVDLSLVGEAAPGAHLLTHLGVAIRALEPAEARAIEDALEAVRLAARGEDFEHLLADLIDREPQLPAHLRATIDNPEPEQPAAAQTEDA